MNNPPEAAGAEGDELPHGLIGNKLYKNERLTYLTVY